MTAEPTPERPLTPEQEDYLRWLSIGYTVVGVLMGIGGFFPIIHLMVGVSVLNESGSGAGAPPPFFGMIFIGMALLMMLLIWSCAIGCFVVANSLANRIRHTLCIVVGGILCMFPPFGTALGVFTLVLLLRPEYKAVFAEKQHG